MIFRFYTLQIDAGGAISGTGPLGRYSMRCVFSKPVFDTRGYPYPPLLRGPDLPAHPGM